MNLYLLAAIALLCALAGVALGHAFSRLRWPYWTIGYFLPLFLILAYALAFPFPTIMFTPPFSWIMIGIRKYAALGFIATIVLTTPLSRIPRKRNRMMIAVLMVFMVFYLAIWPFLAPMMDRGQLSRLQTKFDNDGVCLQSTDYTCGPAAAVTALRKLGLTAEEGEMAILTCTSFQEGTPLDMLADALRRQYAASGLSVHCRVFHSVSELKQAGVTLAVVKYGFFVDHWVAVLGATDSEVIVGDPLGGLERIPYQDFARKWRFIGIVLQRKMPI